MSQGLVLLTGGWFSSAKEDGPWNAVAANQDEEDDGQDDAGPQQEAAVGQGEGAQGNVDNKPSTKTALQALREKYGNTMKLVSHLYKDLTLRDDMRMIACGIHWFLVEYTSALEQQKSQDRMT